MKKPVLYLMVGYPGSGKTTTSEIIRSLTGATHIWADYERRAMFGEPTHSAEESRKLYDHLNKTTEILLSEGSDVIFDTNFNFQRDRDLLRSVADKYNVDTKLVWIQIDKTVAHERATSNGHAASNNYPKKMLTKDFKRLTGHLELPSSSEHPVLLDGTKISAEYVASKLGLPKPKTNDPLLKMALRAPVSVPGKSKTKY